MDGCASGSLKFDTGAAIPSAARMSQSTRAKAVGGVICRAPLAELPAGDARCL